MRSLPLYKAPPRCAVEDSHALPVDSGCRRCALGGKGKVTCMSAEGEPGGLLVVLDAPGRDEEASGRPLVSRTGLYVRSLMKKYWPGPVVYDYAVRCPASGEDAADSIESCRPYLAQTIAESSPTRILCMGQHAVASVLGRAVSTMDTRRGYAWLNLGTDRPAVPVFFFPHPVIATRNRIIRNEWFEPDLRWALSAEVPVDAEASWHGEVATIEDVFDAQQVLSLCRKAAFTSIDCEWSGYPFNADHTLLSVSLTPCSDTAPLLHGGYVFGYTALADPAIRQALAAWVSDPAAKKTGSNLKADVLALKSALGVMLQGQVGDTRFMRRLLESDAKADLATMAELIGMGGHKEEMEQAGAAGVRFIRGRYTAGSSPAQIVSLIAQLHGETGVKAEHVKKVLNGDNPKVYRMSMVDPVLMQRYNARDTLTTGLLHIEFERRLASEDTNLRRVWQTLALPVAEALGQVESWGMPVDREALANFGEYLKAEMFHVGQRFQQYGSDFNPLSQADVSELLFKKLGVKPTSFTATGKPSTDKEAMNEYAKLHPVAADLLRYRKLSKLRGTYADGDDGDGGLLTHVRDDGRIHPSINPDGARTGRTSSSGPNLQNIPRADTVEGKMMRDCFVAPRGWRFVELDHSQLELRIAADQSGDPEMLAIFHSGEDYHLRTARMIAPQAWPGIDPMSIDKESPERTLAKSVNFGVLYDDDPYGLAFRLGIPVAQATRIRDALFGRFKKLAAYIQDRVRESMRSGTARTWWAGDVARRRWLTELGEVDEKARKTARRGSWNTPIQGTGSDYLLAGLVDVVRWILSEGVMAQVCVPVHDSILALVHDDDLAEYLYVVPRLMTSFPTRSGVPLVVDAKVGRSWGSMEKVKLK